MQTANAACLSIIPFVVMSMSTLNNHCVKSSLWVPGKTGVSLLRDVFPLSTLFPLFTISFMKSSKRFGLDAIAAINSDCSVSPSSFKSNKIFRLSALSSMYFAASVFISSDLGICFTLVFVSLCAFCVCSIVLFCTIPFIDIDLFSISFLILVFFCFPSFDLLSSRSISIISSFVFFGLISCVIVFIIDGLFPLELFLEPLDFVDLADSFEFSDNVE